MNCDHQFFHDSMDHMRFQIETLWRVLQNNGTPRDWTEFADAQWHECPCDPCRRRRDYATCRCDQCAKYIAAGTKEVLP